jgi:hypothetical protein
MGGTAGFMGLHLDKDVLRTPDGDLPLADVTRAEFVREAVVDGRKPDAQETSAPAVAGGAAAGGVLLGVPGAVVGGLLGSAVKEDVAGGPSIKTLSVHVVFETEDVQYSTAVPREEEVNAIRFVRKVEDAVRRHRR